MYARRVYGTVAERIAPKHEVDPVTGCWIWTAAIGRDGYGRFDKKQAHRVSYEVHVGPIPDGLQIDHLCRNRRCVNPAHLEPVTQRENILRGESVSAQRARQTHCKRGHPLEGANLARRPRYRTCLTCHRLRMRAKRHGYVFV